jgi:hypothetical protein
VLLSRMGWYGGARRKFLGLQDHLHDLLALLAKELE